uniref:Molybdopterin synthase catalytic subunit n=1 Tax=Canis lupus familiaris TaxID=9615 RepID=A0A8C0S0B1_CANLF
TSRGAGAQPEAPAAATLRGAGRGAGRGGAGRGELCAGPARARAEEAEGLRLRTPPTLLRLRGRDTGAGAAAGWCCGVRKDLNEIEEKPKDIIKFTAEKLSVDEVSQLVISPLCGAVSLFVGTTRNNFEGKKVISLEYEAYLPMAENEIRKICSDIRQKWPVKHIAVFHRLGLVPVSEASVIIAVSSVHRASSLQAVSYAIDTLKAKVPIWKKEMYEESSSSWKRNKECFW